MRHVLCCTYIVYYMLKIDDPTKCSLLADFWRSINNNKVLSNLADIDKR